MVDVMEHVRLQDGLRGLNHTRQFKDIGEAFRKGKSQWEACHGNKDVEEDERTK